MRIPLVSRVTGKCLRCTPTQTLLRTHTRRVCPQQLGSSVWFEFKQESRNSEGCVTVEFLAASLCLSFHESSNEWLPCSLVCFLVPNKQQTTHR